MGAYSPLLIAVACFLLVVCLSDTHAYRIMYRAHWDTKSSANATNCAGLPTAVAIKGNVESGACSQAAFSQECTFYYPDTYIKDICVEVRSNFDKDSLSHRPPFDGTWIEVRTKSTSTPCNQQTLDNSAVIQGWYQNGVCTINYSNYKSRVYFNSTSAEFRLRCSTNDCEGQCSSSAVIPSNSYVQTDVACTSNGYMLYFVRPVQPLPPTPQSSSKMPVIVYEYYLSNDCSSTPYSVIAREVSSTASCASSMCQAAIIGSVKSFCSSNYVPSFAHAKTVAFEDSSCSIINAFNLDQQYTPLGCIAGFIGSIKAECNATHYKTASCDAGCGTCGAESVEPLNTCQYLRSDSYKRVTCALGSANNVHSNVMMGMVWTVVVYLLISILLE